MLLLCHFHRSGNSMAITWQTHALMWPCYSNGIAMLMPGYCHDIAMLLPHMVTITWYSHGSIMGTAWQQHGIAMVLLVLVVSMICVSTNSMDVNM